MALKDILVHVDNDKGNAARVNAALQLSLEHQAHLTGLFVIPEFFIPTYAEVQIPAEVFEAQDKATRQEAGQAEAVFRDLVKPSGVAFEWHCVKGYPDRELIAHSAFTDLVIISQAEQRSRFGEGSELEDLVLLGAARPVLLIPYIGAPAAIGKRVLVAWNNSREAVRAVNGAMPLLQRAEKVTVLAVNPPTGSGDIPTADICKHLARHGVNTEASQTVAKDIEVGDVLLSRVSDDNIDLLVMGAYGHTRLRETVLGGVSRDILAHMTVPVLMSH